MIVQKFVEGLRIAVKKGLIDMNLLINFGSISSNGQLPQPIIGLLHHILGRVDVLEQDNIKLEHLKQATNPVQVGGFGLILAIGLAKIGLKIAILAKIA